MKCSDIIAYLEALSPGKYACNWDNVGLLVGRKNHEVKKIMVALDATNSVIQKAVGANADMLITHHPMIFSGMKKINDDAAAGCKVLDLVENGICCYAMHTNYDIVGGMAELAAGEKYLNLSDVKPMTIESEDGEGLGRFGRLPKPMTGDEASQYVKDKFHLPFVMLYHDEALKDKIFEDIAVLPGSGKSELATVKREGYSLYLTGDFGHHDGIDAVDMGITVIDATHYGLEHIFTEFIKDYLTEKLSDNDVEIVTAVEGCPMRIV